MAKVLTLSRTYPPYHPCKGEETFFVEKVLNSLGDPCIFDIYFETLRELNLDLPEKTLMDFWLSLDWNCGDDKHHTIRAGHRFRTGDMASLRVWGNDVNPKSGRSGPYHSKQIIIAPDVQVRCWWFEITNKREFLLEGNKWPIAVVTDGGTLGEWNLRKLAANDGLTVPDLKAWFKFPKPFSGQVICWNDNIDY